MLEPSTGHAIICDNLKKVYPGRDGNPEKFAVRGLSLALPRGECFGMLGPNGAGKTSFINMVSSMFLLHLYITEVVTIQAVTKSKHFILLAFAYVSCLTYLNITFNILHELLLRSASGFSFLSWPDTERFVSILVFLLTDDRTYKTKLWYCICSRA